MKITGARLSRFLKSPDGTVRAALLFGPDRGLVRERAAALTRAVIGAVDDGFRLVELPAKTVRDDPARLGDEAASMCLTGGKRVVRVSDATDALADAVRGLLELPGANALALIEGGDLPPRSRLRKLFEDEPSLVAIPCYLDTPESLEQLIGETFATAGLSIGGEAKAYLVGHLGADRGSTRRELEKVITFKGGQGTVALEDVRAAVGDGIAASSDAVITSAMAGDGRALEAALSRAFGEGVAPIALLRALARHLQRLHLAQATVAAGKSPQQAMNALTPRVFQFHQPAFRAQMEAWSPTLLGSALSIVTEAEIECKSTGLPAEAICSRALMRLAHAARSLRSRREFTGTAAP